MDSRDTYKEKGTGMLKVNVRKSDGKGARLSKWFADKIYRLAPARTFLMMFAQSCAPMES